jgi:hypothetical protein
MVVFPTDLLILKDLRTFHRTTAFRKFRLPVVEVVVFTRSPPKGFHANSRNPHSTGRVCGKLKVLISPEDAIQ